MMTNSQISRLRSLTKRRWAHISIAFEEENQTVFGVTASTGVSRPPKISGHLSRSLARTHPSFRATNFIPSSFRSLSQRKLRRHLTMSYKAAQLRTSPQAIFTTWRGKYSGEVVADIRGCPGNDCKGTGHEAVISHLHGVSASG
jgi:hypothetical protein